MSRLPSSKPQPKAGAAAGEAEAGVAAGAGMAAAAMLVAQKMGQAAVDNVRAQGQVGQAVAALDPGAIADSVGSALKMIPVFGEALGESVTQLKAFDSAIMGTAQKLAGFSPALAQAEAEAGVRGMQGDMRRAEMLGPDLAKYVEARSNIEEELKDMLAEILHDHMPLIIDTLRGLGKIGEVVIKGVDILAAIEEATADVLSGKSWSEAAGKIQSALNRVAKNTEKHNTGENTSVSHILETLRAGGGFGMRAAGAAANARRAGRQAAFPGV